ncbi:MAG: hypothetical protein Q8Q18_03640 [bacterium]|nr:hypothetical protein [bacterium]
MARTPTRFSLEISDEVTAEALIGDGIRYGSNASKRNPKGLLE